MFQIKVKLDLEIFFKQIQTHFAFKDIFVVLIILYSNILYFANNFIVPQTSERDPFQNAISLNILKGHQKLPVPLIKYIYNAIKYQSAQ